jgi:hypothetical protein
MVQENFCNTCDPNNHKKYIAYIEIHVDLDGEFMLEQKQGGEEI